jgi:AcrR family transcriptional regulator
MTRADRERQLLAIATVVFTTRGFIDTTMEEIADQAGITKPVIYDHFGSKEGLLAACVAAAVEEIRAATIEAWEIERPGETMKDYLRVNTRAYLEYFADNDSSLRLIHDLSAASPDGSATVERMRQDQVRASVEILRRAERLRDAPGPYLEAIAEGIVGVTDRLTVWRLRHPETTVDETVELVAAVMWGGLRAIIAPLDPGVVTAGSG